MTDRTDSPSRGGRVRRWLIPVGLSLALGVAVGAAAVRVLTPPPEITGSRALGTAVVSPGEVGSTISLGAQATWPTAGVVTNLAEGVVTSINLKSGKTLTRPQRIFSVDERPVFVASGAVPAYRAIDATCSGRDVAQLQKMLNQLGFAVGPADGRGDATLTSSVKRWQRSVGYPADGVVRLGDLLFVPKLPVRLALANAASGAVENRDPAAAEPTLAVGRRLSGGEVVLNRLAANPRVTVTTAKEQAAFLRTKMPVTLHHEDHSWPGEITRMEVINDELVLRLAKRNGKPMCGKDCSVLPADRATVMSADFEVVKAVKGASVPVGAIQTRADGSAYVVTAEGLEQSVKVLAGDSGVAIIEGVPEGTRVGLFSNGPR